MHRAEPFAFLGSPRVCALAVLLLVGSWAGRTWLWPNQASLADALASEGHSTATSAGAPPWEQLYADWDEAALRDQYEALSEAFLVDANLILDHKEQMGDTVAVQGAAQDVAAALAATGRSAIHWRLVRRAADPTGRMRLVAVFADEQPPLHELYQELAWLRRAVGAPLRTDSHSTLEEEQQ